MAISPTHSLATKPTPHPYSHAGRKFYTPLVHANSGLALRTRAHYNKLRRSRSSSIYQRCVGHWAYQLAFRCWTPATAEKMEETKRELVKEGEGRPELFIDRQGSVRVVANAVVGGKSNRTGDFPGKDLPDWREYSNRCPRRRREWLVRMEERYGRVGNCSVRGVNGDEKVEKKGKEREGFSEKLEPIPIMKRPARYRRYCLAKFMGKTFDDESSDSSSDDEVFDFAFMKRRREEDKKEKKADSAESSNNSTSFERDGESGSGSSSSKSSGKMKMQNFLNKFSFKKPAASDFPPPLVPADAKEKNGESNQRPPLRSGKTQPHEIKKKCQGTDRANSFPGSRSSGNARRSLPSGRKEGQQRVGLSLNDLSTPSRRKTHASSHDKIKTYIPTCTQNLPSKTHNDSPRSPSKASSSKPSIVHNPPSHFRPQPLPPMPSDVCKILKQVDRDNKDVGSCVPLIASPLLPTPSPSPPKHGEEVREPRDLSDKGKQKLDELRTACEARLNEVAHDAAERAREEIRREREIAENEKERQERKEKIDPRAEAKTEVERESELKQEELTTSAHQNKDEKTPSRSPSSSKTRAENSAPKDTNAKNPKSLKTATKSENSQPSASTSKSTQRQHHSNQTQRDPIPLPTPPTSHPIVLRHKSRLPPRTPTKIPLPSSCSQSPRTHSPSPSSLLNQPHPVTTHGRSSSLPTPSISYLTKHQRAPSTPMTDKRKTAPGSLGVSVPREVERIEGQARGSLRRSSRAVWRYQVERAGSASRKRE